MKTGISVFILFSIFSGLGYWYIAKSLQVAELEKVQLSEQNSEASLQKSQQLKTQMIELNKQLEIAKDSASQSAQLIERLTLELDETKNKVIKAELQADETEKRAGWLLKLNRQLKAQVTRLTEEAKQLDVDPPEEKVESITPSKTPVENETIQTAEKEEAAL